VPVAKEDAFYDKAKGWLDDLLSSCTTANDTSVGVKCIMEYLLKRHRRHSETVLRQNGLMPKVMNEFEVAATMKHAGIGYQVWRSIVQSLKGFLGLEKVCVPESVYRELGKDHSDIKVGTFEYVKEDGKRFEKIDYFTLDALAELKKKVEEFVNSTNDFDPRFIEYIHSVYGGDHGQGGSLGFQASSSSTRGRSSMTELTFSPR
jgi:hypothetical protein